MNLDVSTNRKNRKVIEFEEKGCGLEKKSLLIYLKNIVKLFIISMLYLFFDFGTLFEILDKQVEAEKLIE